MPEDPKIVVRPHVGAQGAEEERQRIVTFLRKVAQGYTKTSRDHQMLGHLKEARQDEDRASIILWETNRIENGDHLKE